METAGQCVVMSAHLAGYHQATGASPGDLLATERENTADVIFDRAVEGGEIKPEHLNERIKSLPFDLLRHEILVTFAPVVGLPVSACDGFLGGWPARPGSEGRNGRMERDGTPSSVRRSLDSGERC